MTSGASQTCRKMEVILLVLLVGYSWGSNIQCKNDKGEPVDWFYIYKMPEESGSSNPLVAEGVAYFYMTPADLKTGWVLSPMSIADPLSMVGRTVSPLYTTTEKVSLVYNDQPPLDHKGVPIQKPLLPMTDMYRKIVRGRSSKVLVSKARFQFQSKNRQQSVPRNSRKYLNFKTFHHESGHTKGVIMGDKTSAYWLVHSVPKFPPVPTSQIVNYAYPKSGTKYGQTFLCISVQTSTLDKIAVQLMFNDPLIMYSHMPKDLEYVLPSLQEVINNVTLDEKPWFHTLNFVSLSGRKFTSFAKSASFHKDLYSGLVADVLQRDLFVQTWTNGPGALDSECSAKFRVQNIKQLRFPAADLTYSTNSDHSKWAVTGVSKGRKDQWVCVGDINRALSQEHRGGGTVCTANLWLWNSFNNLIESTDLCK